MKPLLLLKSKITMKIQGISFLKSQLYIIAHSLLLLKSLYLVVLVYIIEKPTPPVLT
jgi:hypothetical protein